MRSAAISKLRFDYSDISSSRTVGLTVKQKRSFFGFVLRDDRDDDPSLCKSD
jgi:hypothetical protein